MQKLQVKVPGKLFIAGEYAVLEPNHEAIVIAVNRFMYGSIEVSSKNKLVLRDLGYENITWSFKNGEVLFSENNAKLLFVQNAITLTSQFLKEQGIDPLPITLSIHSELDDQSGKKLGLGSSAAIVVTVVASLLHIHSSQGLQFTKEQLFKLAALIHYKTQGNGSCADIAASTFGGWLVYSAFDGEWLKKEIQNDRTVTEILNQQWPNLYIQQLTPPKNLELCVGWTGESASTGSLVSKVKKQSVEQENVYQEFLKSSKQAVKKIAKSFERNDIESAISGLTANREALRILGESMKIPIETDDLRKLIHIANRFGSGKSSGAGGGDCGIAFVRNQEDVEKLKNEWLTAQITPLDLEVSSEGATVVNKQ